MNEAEKERLRSKARATFLAAHKTRITETSSIQIDEEDKVEEQPVPDDMPELKNTLPLLSKPSEKQDQQEDIKIEEDGDEEITIKITDSDEDEDKEQVDEDDQEEEDDEQEEEDIIEDEEAIEEEVEDLVEEEEIEEIEEEAAELDDLEMEDAFGYDDGGGGGGSGDENEAPKKKRRTKTSTKSKANPKTTNNKVVLVTTSKPAFVKYEKRLKLLPAANFACLDQAYLSDYGLSTIIKKWEKQVAKSGDGTYLHHAQVLYKIAKEHSINVLGYTSENKKRGKYEKLPCGGVRESEGGSVRVVYVGKLKKSVTGPTGVFCIRADEQE